MGFDTIEINLVKVKKEFEVKKFFGPKIFGSKEVLSKKNCAL